VRVLGNVHLAEDVVQDAAIRALDRWPVDGIPDHPDRWLFTVARRRAIDLIRRDVSLRHKLAELERIDAPAAEDRLTLVFMCCHPALSREAQVALTLRTSRGRGTAQITRALLVSESAVAQRLARSRRKIVDAGIPFRVPDPDELGTRLAQVLDVIYLVFNEGYLATEGERPERHELLDEAEWLAAMLGELMPREPECLALLALIRLHRARAATRFDADGRLVLLMDQDRTRWDHEAIAEAANLVVRAARMRRPGPYQLQAAIAACHAEASSWEETDWLQVLLLYDALLRSEPSPVYRLHRAVAVRFVDGPTAALREVDALGDILGGHRLFHATRAELLRDLGRPEEAREADRRALRATANPAERLLIEERLA
jgi:RNA polymerase sigma factor (sigma-70 family)